MEPAEDNPVHPKPTPPGSSLIRFCVNNPRNLQERQELFDRGFVCRDCLSNCTRCFETRFLEIDDKFVEGESYDEILKKHPPSSEHQTG